LRFDVIEDLLDYVWVSDDGRLRMLNEACQIMKGLFNNDYYDFEGEFYQLKHAPLEPNPSRRSCR